MSTARAIWLDYLRAFVTLLVVAHHAALAYATFAHFDNTHYIWSTAPIVDDNRWVGMDTFIGFNDLFFMPLMFLISGLFVHRGLARKGSWAYMRDRFVRLGIPFIIAELVLIPLAYLPSFYQATGSASFISFVTDYITNQQWPVGPPWFIWLLLAFDGVAALLFNGKPSLFPQVGNRLALLSQQPVRFGATIYGLVSLSLIPISLWVGQYTWVGNWGPFDFQLNRLFFYLFFFLLGSCLGATDWQRYLFRQNRFLGISWMVWLVACLLSYAAFVLISKAGATLTEQSKLTATQAYLLYDLAFVGSCLASMGACMSFFYQNVTKSIGGWTNLTANAYGIYVVHYGFVTWLQFALLSMNWPVIVKFIVVFAGAVMLSWFSTSLARRNALITRII